MSCCPIDKQINRCNKHAFKNIWEGKYDKKGKSEFRIQRQRPKKYNEEIKEVIIIDCQKLLNIKMQIEGR